ncbi:hypothetical protein [Pseudomonas sp. Leaf127]|uniref:hypothetical protein n=1 Tax=Pseudomonas sp. Leaf127 TaxID=1736267 RepID=UPI000A5D7DBF|nr:hypothetical protein [Pseudomonas sp. Leaf127]
MHTIVYLFKRKPGLTRAQFSRLYLDHGRLMVRFAIGLLRYEQFPARQVRRGWPN